MKPLNKIALILVFSILIIGAKSSIDTTNKQLPLKIEILEKNNTSDKISDLQNQLRLVLGKNDDLQRRIDLSSTIIQGQDSFINRTLMTYSILMALIAVILGLVSYFFLIKPSSDLVKEAKEQEKKLDDKFNNKIIEINNNFAKHEKYIENIGKDIKENLDKKFLEFIRDNKKKEIEVNLDFLKSNELFQKTTATSFFAVNQDITLTEEQSEMIYNIINSIPNINQNPENLRMKSTLEFTLSKQPYKYSEIYFRNALKQESYSYLNSGTVYNALRYFEYTMGFDNYVDDIVNIILLSNSPFNKYKLIIQTALQLPKNITYSLINNEKLNNLFDYEQLCEIIQIIYYGSTYIEGGFLNESYLQKLADIRREEKIKNKKT